MRVNMICLIAFILTACIIPNCVGGWNSCDTDVFFISSPTSRWRMKLWKLPCCRRRHRRYFSILIHSGCFSQNGGKRRVGGVWKIQFPSFSYDVHIFTLKSMYTLLYFTLEKKRNKQPTKTKKKRNKCYDFD